MYGKLIKPFLDSLISLIGIIILSPVLLIVIVLLFIANSGHPFFTQTRPGKNGRLFKVIKFKTMHNDHNAQGSYTRDNLDARICNPKLYYALILNPSKINVGLQIPRDGGSNHQSPIPPEAGRHQSPITN